MNRSPGLAVLSVRFWADFFWWSSHFLNSRIVGGGGGEGEGVGVGEGRGMGEGGMGGGGGGV